MAANANHSLALRIVIFSGLICLSMAQKQSQCVGIRGVPSDAATKACCEELRYGCAGIWPGQCQSCSTVLDYHVGEFNNCCRRIPTLPGGRAKTFNPWDQYSRNPIGAAPSGSGLPNLSGGFPQVPNLPGGIPQIPNLPGGIPQIPNLPQYPHF